jgi:hypothetical protein
MGAVYGTQLNRCTFLCTVALVLVTSVAKSQTTTIEGLVYSGVDASCVLLDDIRTGTTFQLHGSVPGLGDCVVASGSVRTGSRSACRRHLSTY